MIGLAELVSAFNIANYVVQNISSLTVMEDSIVVSFYCSQNEPAPFIVSYFQDLGKQFISKYFSGSAEGGAAYFNTKAFPFHVDWAKAQLTPDYGGIYKLKIPVDNNVERNLKRCFARLLSADIFDKMRRLSKKEDIHADQSASNFDDNSFYYQVEFCYPIHKKVVDTYIAAIKYDTKNYDYRDFWSVNADRGYARLYNVDNAALIKDLTQQIREGLAYNAFKLSNDLEINVLKNAVAELIFARTGIEIAEYHLIEDGNKDHAAYVLMKKKSGGNLSHEEAAEICKTFSLHELKSYQGNYVFPIEEVAHLIFLVEQNSIIKKEGNHCILKINPKLYIPRDIIENRLKRINSRSHTHRQPVQQSVAKSNSRIDETPIAQLIRIYNIINYYNGIEINFKLENNNLKIVFSGEVKVDEDTFLKYIASCKKKMEENLYESGSGDVKKDDGQIKKIINHIFATTDSVKAKPGANNTLTILLDENALLYLKKQVAFLLIYPIIGKVEGSSMNLPSDENSCKYSLTFPSPIVQYQFSCEFQLKYHASYMYAFKRIDNKELHFNDIFGDHDKLYIQDFIQSLAYLCLKERRDRFEESITKCFTKLISVTPSSFKYFDLKNDRPDLKGSKAYLKERLVLICKKQNLFFMTERQASEFNEKFGHEVLTDIKDKTSDPILKDVKGEVYGINFSDRKGYHIICKIIEDANLDKDYKLFNPVKSSERATSSFLSEVSIHKPGISQGCRPKEQKRS